MPVILQSNLADYIKDTLREINDGVKAARDSGITGAIMPEEVKFDIVLVTQINAFVTSSSQSDPITTETSTETGNDNKSEVMVATDEGETSEETTGTDTKTGTTTQTENGTETGTTGRTGTSTVAGTSTDNSTTTETPGVETTTSETTPVGQTTVMSNAGAKNTTQDNTYDL